MSDWLHLIRCTAIAVLLIGISRPVFGQERPDRPRALEFFHQVQAAVRGGDRDSLADMVYYPVYVFIHGKRIRLRSRKALMQNFDLVFDQEVRCAILSAKDEEIHAYKFGYIVHLGEINFEDFIPPGNDTAAWVRRGFGSKGTFKIRAVHNGLERKTCEVKVD
jgi:hypothetical protein